MRSVGLQALIIETYTPCALYNLTPGHLAHTRLVDRRLRFSLSRAMLPLPLELRLLLLQHAEVYSGTSLRVAAPRRHSSSTTASRAETLIVLGLESSADDSCAAVVNSHREILSNVVMKQESLLERYRGIHPLAAQHQHARNLPLAIRAALKEAGDLSLSDLDGIAYTRGPGMAGCLQACSASAKALAAATGLPLMGVHHMVSPFSQKSAYTHADVLAEQQAHALTPFLTESEPPRFPFMTLLLSGGHTLLLLARSETSFKILATTHDESIG